jgi:hypothetical protein
MAGNHPKLCFNRAIGVYVGREHVTLTDVGVTPTGRTVIGRYSEPVGDGGPAAALKQLLTGYLNPRQLHTSPICLGLGPERTFFMTCANSFGPQEKPSLDKLLRACGTSAELDAWNMVGDYAKLSKPRMTAGQGWSVAACQRSLAEELFAVVQEVGAHQARLQPVALSLLHTLHRRNRKHKGWNAVVHVFLNDTAGLAILALADHVVLWRGFAPTKDNPIQAAKSAVRALRCYAQASLYQSDVDGVIVHNPTGASWVGQLNEDMGIPTVASDEGEFDDARFSYGLTLAARSDEQTPFDLFRTLRSTPSILSNFPWKRAGVVATAAAIMLFVMWNKAAAIDQRYSNLRRQSAERKWATGKKTSEIKTERKLLMSEVDAVSKFLSTRVLWSNYLRDLPTRVPSNAGLWNLAGFCELKETSKKETERRTKKSLTLRGMTRFEKGRAAPEEIDAFLESLRNADLLKKDFPQVTLAEIKWRREGSSEMAIFTVVALPNKEKPGAASKDSE